MVGIPLAVAATFIQYLLFNSIEIFENISVVNYDGLQWLWIGLALGLGALLGDSIESFFKRQTSIAPGKDWPFWDQSQESMDMT